MMVQSDDVCSFSLDRNLPDWCKGKLFWNSCSHGFTSFSILLQLFKLVHDDLDSMDSDASTTSLERDH